MGELDEASAPDATALNRASWNERAVLHGQDDHFYDTSRVLAGASSLSGLELFLVGEVRDQDLLHLQCHIGLDSISWARRGGRVTAIDFSPAAITKARHLAEQANAPVEFVVADVCDLPAALHARFDLAVATYGIFCWIGDLDAWARNAAATLRPGGRLIVVDGHPLLQMLDRAEPLTVDFPYADTGPQRCYSDTTYAAADRPLTAGHTVQWAHSLGEILTAIAIAGLRLDEVHEPLSSELNIRPNVLSPGPDGQWSLNIWPHPLPVLLALVASKPG